MGIYVGFWLRCAGPGAGAGCAGVVVYGLGGCGLGRGEWGCGGLDCVGEG